MTGHAIRQGSAVEGAGSTIAGNLRALELAELLQLLAQGAKTGMLVVSDGQVEKRI